MTPLILRLVGVLTVVLGIAHFFLPKIVSIESALIEPTVPLQVPCIRYVPTRRDMYGLVLIMNYAVSFALLTIGVLDWILPSYLDQDAGRVIAVWIAAWWFIRAAAQLHLGRRPFDRFVVVAFSLFGFLHLVAAYR